MEWAKVGSLAAAITAKIVTKVEGNQTLGVVLGLVAGLALAHDRVLLEKEDIGQVAALAVRCSRKIVRYLKTRVQALTVVTCCTN